jgi:type II secretory ATPase GspE/PulE/Tfp pilus assembly ATPase PilB-like protein
VEASLTGHFVLSTLHTNSAPETVIRLLDLGLDPLSFADALQGILAQRLVRRLCPKCKKPRPVTEFEHDIIKTNLAGLGEDVSPDAIIYEAAGCKKCGGTGYYGRIGIHELLLANQSLRDLIYRKASAAEFKKIAEADGMRSLLQDGIHKVLIGMIDFVQLRKVVGL